MEDGARPEPAPRRPAPAAAGDAPATDAPPGPPHLSDPRALTILTTEHWSLLTARSLVYNEAFSRGAMFLTFVSASLVALGFVAGGGAAGPELPLVAIALLALDLFVGLATLGRLVGAGTEEMRALQGMARLRHAYLEMAPDLEPYFTTARHDDLLGILSAYGSTPQRPNGAQNVVHGLTTMPGLVAVIDSALAGGLVAMLAVTAGLTGMPALLAGIVAGVLLMAVLAGMSGRVFMRQGESLVSRFPTPGPADQAPGRRNT